MASNLSTKLEYPFLHLQCTEFLQQVKEAGQAPILESFLSKVGRIIEENYRFKFDSELSDCLKAIDQDIIEDLGDDLTRELIRIGSFHDSSPKNELKPDEGEGKNKQDEEAKANETGAGAQVKGKRKFPTCPKCNIAVKDLNRHLISKHGAADRNEAKKMRIEAGQEIKDKRKFKKCPECKRDVYRLDKHLATVHDDLYRKDSEAFKEAMRVSSQQTQSGIKDEEKGVPPTAEQMNKIPSTQTDLNTSSCNPSTSTQQIDIESPSISYCQVAVALNKETYGCIAQRPNNTEKQAVQDLECNVQEPLLITASQDTPDSIAKASSNNKDEAKDPTYYPDHEYVSTDSEDSLEEDSENNDIGMEVESEFSNPRKAAKCWSTLHDSQNTIEATLAGFWRHLQRPEGGMKKNVADANETTSKIYRLMVFLTESCKRPLTFDVFRYPEEIWDNFVQGKEGFPGKLKMQTKYIYVCCLEKFLHFLLNFKNKTAKLSYQAQEDLRATSGALRGWKEAFKPLLKKERTDKRVHKRETALTLTEIHEMNKSEGVKLDKDMLENANPSQDYSLREHNRARDYLIFQIIHLNAQQAGIAYGFLVSEFNNAEWREKDERYVILVKDHKTGLDGPAPIVVTKELYELMKKYHDVFRPLALAENNGQDCGKFFLTKNGSPVVSTQVSNIFTRIGKRYGRADKGRLYPTKFRQAAATSVSKETQEKREDLSRLMTHRESTQRKYYIIEDTIERSVRAQKELAKKFKPDASPKKGRPIAIEDEADNEIKTLFKKEIQQKANVTVEAVEDKIKGNMVLQGLQTSQISRRVHYLAGLETVPELPVETETVEERIERWETSTQSTNTIQPTVSSQGKRRQWDENEEEVLKRVYSDLFKKGAKLPRTHQIKKAIKESEDEEFQMLVLSFGKEATTRILNKCKAMHTRFQRLNNK